MSQVYTDEVIHKYIYSYKIICNLWTFSVKDICPMFLSCELYVTIVELW